MPKTKHLKSRSAAHPHAQEPPSENRYFSRAVGKAIQMLEMLSHSGTAMRLNDLSRQTQLTKSSALRLLQTLETLHYIRRDANGHYVSANQNGAPVSTQYINSILAAAKEPMRQLNMEFGETVSLAVLINNHIEVVHVVESANLIRMTNIVGRILPPHASSMGKMITAWQDNETRKRLLQSYGLTRYNENTITDERTIEEEYARIRSRGYSTDTEETNKGGFCFSAGIFSAPSTLEAAVSISMPKSRLPEEEHRKKMIHSLNEAACLIGKKLGKTS